MAKISEEPFTPKHFALFYGAPGYTADMITDEYLTLLSRHPSAVVFADGKPIGAGGVILPWHGVGEAWALTLPAAARYKREYLRWTRDAIQRVIVANTLHRVQCTVLADFHAGRRWAVALGFQPECVLRLAGPNKETSIQFVMFPEGD